jgi:uncharacterized protein YaiI (UPF0178 family)
VLHVFVDADACPVKEEIYRVARRCGLSVTLVANSWMRTPDDERISLQVVKDGFDAADDWIAGRAGPGDIVITADLPLASRCLAGGARVIGPTGNVFTEQNIGDAVATRDLMAELREAGMATGGPAPIGRRDRSRFLQRLDETVHSIRREHSVRD